MRSDIPANGLLRRDDIRFHFPGHGVSSTTKTMQENGSPGRNHAKRIHTTRTKPPNHLSLILVGRHLDIHDVNWKKGIAAIACRGGHGNPTIIFPGLVQEKAHC